MKIRKQYLAKYLHDIAIEQLAEDYSQKGYEVTRDAKLGNFETDLIVKKGNDQIVIEVKTSKMNPERKKRISEIADYINTLGGYKFHVVLATPPKEKKLEIEEDIKNLIIKHLEQLPKFDEKLLLVTSVSKKVYDIDIDEISIKREQVVVKGDGLVSVEDDEPFPFEFEITLAYNSENKLLKILTVDRLEIDSFSYSDKQ